MIDFVCDLLVNKINKYNENPCVETDTVLFLAEVFRLVGQNYKTTKITMETTAELIGRLIFKPRQVNLKDVKTYSKINLLFLFIMENLDEVKKQVYGKQRKLPLSDLRL